MCECDCDACMNCEEEEEYETVSVSCEDKDWVRLSEGKNILVIQNMKHKSIRSRIWAEDCVLMRETIEDGKVLNSGVLDEFDWKQGLLYGIKNGSMEVVKEEE